MVTVFVCVGRICYFEYSHKWIIDLHPPRSRASSSDLVASTSSSSAVVAEAGPSTSTPTVTPSRGKGKIESVFQIAYSRGYFDHI